MSLSLRKVAIAARNQAVYRQHSFWARVTRRPFPLDSASDFVVTMASYPGRIHQVPAVFESLARQAVRPKKAYLVLADEEFPDHKVPQGIERLSDRGIEIVWSRKNPFAVKKLVEVWPRNPGCSIAVFDDDFIYAPDVLQVLHKHASGRANSVLGFIGKEMLRRGESLSRDCRKSAAFEESEFPSRLRLHGGLGTWYQPGSLDERFLNRDAFTSIVPGRGSDMWFWAAAVAAGSPQVCLARYRHSKMFIPIPETERSRPRDLPGFAAMESRFQRTIDYFGIREKLIQELRDVRTV